MTISLGGIPILPAVADLSAANTRRGHQTSAFFERASIFDDLNTGDAP
jgi:hypothetical protein